MANDIGMIKSVLPSAVQSKPVASTGRTGPDLQARDSSHAAREAEKAEQERQPLDRVVSDLNKLVRELHRELNFSVDEDSGETVIKVIDRQTHEVVRQIPGEEVMRLRQRLEEAAGVFFQDSA